MLIKNKKAQMGETMTWVVATLIILFLLSISIYGASVLANLKSDPSSALSLGHSRTQDVVMENSLFAYFSVEDGDLKNEIKSNLGELNDQENFPYKDFDERFEELKEVLEG